MGSLWRNLAARWLGGAVPDTTLTGDTVLLDLLMQSGRDRPSSVVVGRQADVSHQAVIVGQRQTNPEDQPALEPPLIGDGEA